MSAVFLDRAAAVQDRKHPATCACCRPDARRALRRPLTYAERHIDVELLTAALDAAKARLAALITAEQRRVARRVDEHDPRPRVTVTTAMLKVLRELFELGQRAAILEARSMGVELEPSPRRPLIRTFAAPISGDRGALTLAAYLARFNDRMRFEALRAINTKVSGVARLGFTGGTFDARAIMARAIVQTPGALDAAGRVVSMQLDAGLADVFGANADAFAGWQYTAVLDGATCPTCEEADGTIYATWDEAMVDMPDGGPNPECDGGSRCRCRLVPIPAGGDQTPAEQTPTPPVVPPEPISLIPEPAAPAAPDGSFSSDLYDLAITHALDPVTGSLVAEASDSLGVMSAGTRSTATGKVLPSSVKVLEHARADHEALMTTGREIHDEIARRVAELPPVTSRSALISERELEHVKLRDYQRVEREVLKERGVTFGDVGDLRFRMPTGDPSFDRTARAPWPKPTGRYRTAGTNAPRTVEAASKRYPAEWSQASSTRQLDGELKLVQQAQGDDRSHYAPGRGIMALTPQAEGRLEVAIHELGHRFEAEIRELVRAERVFYEWRARGGSWTGRREGARKLFPGSRSAAARRETSIFDGWHEAYMGKAYPGMAARDAELAAIGGRPVYHGAYEIISQAMGEAFAYADLDAAIPRVGSKANIRGDAELMQWLYGVLVHVRPAG